MQKMHGTVCLMVKRCGGSVLPVKHIKRHIRCQKSKSDREISKENNRYRIKRIKEEGVYAL